MLNALLQCFENATGFRRFSCFVLMKTHQLEPNVKTRYTVTKTTSKRWELLMFFNRNVPAKKILIIIKGKESQLSLGCVSNMESSVLGTVLKFIQKLLLAQEKSSRPKTDVKSHDFCYILFSSMAECWPNSYWTRHVKLIQKKIRCNDRQFIWELNLFSNQPFRSPRFLPCIWKQYDQC